ncbi:CheR family methyltransferase [Loktanella agnita]|uniref:CheR family methyltransferase n=1 Tax=Loktanella agnita TaxID=287097 RepID=UPI00398587E5
MNIASPPPPTQADQSEYAFSDRDFARIAALANAKYGIYLQSSKKALVYSRLARRLRALNLSDFETYCDLLQQADSGGEEEHLLSALTTNVTHFFREKHHFDFLRNQLLPDLVARAKSGAAVRVWSSACSAGQEAYCIAAMVLDACAEAGTLDIRILATDIDPQIIVKAKQGIYPKDQQNAIPDQYRAIMIDTSKGDEAHFCMHKKLGNLISFGQLNLIADWPMRRPFDVIFCRNAAIYFDKNTQSRLWGRFADALTPEGHLMIGHSERLCGPAEQRFASVDITTYRKTDAPGIEMSSKGNEKP